MLIDTIIYLAVGAFAALVVFLGIFLIAVVAHTIAETGIIQVALILSVIYVIGRIIVNKGVW